MNRSVYSLVLSDDVVEAVDRLAYQQNTSRSALINQILAEAVSFVTPEMRMREIFSQVEALMDGMDAFQVNTQPSDAILSIKSPLRYKYKPTLRYAVELYRAPRPAIGELRVSARTPKPRIAGIPDRVLPAVDPAGDPLHRLPVPRGGNPLPGAGRAVLPPVFPPPRGDRQRGAGQGHHRLHPHV